MDTESRLSKTIIGIFVVTMLAIGAFSYWFFTTPSADKQRTLSYVAESAHTGMVGAPLTQLAMGGNSPNSNLAQGNQNGAHPAGQGSAVAMGNPLSGNPTVLFDISSQPLFGKNGMSPQALILMIFTIPGLALLFLYMWDQLKKRKIKR